MFSLIITIISIALVAALAVATIYYGGDAFNQGTTKAKASTIVNQAQQIAGANTLYKSNTGSFATGLSALVADKYLGSAPVSADVSGDYAVDSVSNVVTATLKANTTEICKQINVIAGTDGTADATKQFSCSGVSFSFKG